MITLHLALLCALKGTARGWIIVMGTWTTSSLDVLDTRLQGLVGRRSRPQRKQKISG